MTDLKDPNGRNDLISDAGTELKGMAKEGFQHPSTKPVLIGAGVGAVVGALTISAPLGLLAGAAFMLYRRVRP